MKAILHTALKAVAASLLIAGAAHAVNAPTYTLTTLNDSNVVADDNGVSFDQAGWIFPTVWQLDSASAASLLAFCIEPGVSTNDGSPSIYTAAGSTSVNTAVQKLYNTSYSLVGNLASLNMTNALSFQLALWELTSDDGNLFDISGKQFFTADSEDAVVQGAFEMLNNNVITGNYALTKFISPGSQTVLAASVAAVPEPETYAMLGAGLGLIGFIGRRKAAKKQA